MQSGKRLARKVGVEMTNNPEQQANKIHNLIAQCAPIGHWSGRRDWLILEVKKEIERGIDQAEARGFERCREMALAINKKYFRVSEALGKACEAIKALKSSPQDGEPKATEGEGA